MRRAISVVKKRSGDHERTIRELQMSERGLEIGEPLKQFHGVLTGVPTLVRRQRRRREVRGEDRREVRGEGRGEGRGEAGRERGADERA